MEELRHVAEPSILSEIYKRMNKLHDSVVRSALDGRQSEVGEAALKGMAREIAGVRWFEAEARAEAEGVPKSEAILKGREAGVAALKRNTPGQGNDEEIIAEFRACFQMVETEVRAERG